MSRRTSAQGANDFIREKVKEGRQVFSSARWSKNRSELDLKAAKDEAARLQSEIFPDLKVGLLHGKMAGAEKERMMKQFLDRKIDILVSTTVIEVGIDVPNATIMMIEHAERFGLSQLHQLRGRIGRGTRSILLFPGRHAEIARGQRPDQGDDRDQPTALRLPKRTSVCGGRGRCSAPASPVCQTSGWLI